MLDLLYTVVISSVIPDERIKNEYNTISLVIVCIKWMINSLQLVITVAESFIMPFLSHPLCVRGQEQLLAFAKFGYA